MAERLVLCGQTAALTAQDEETLRLSLDGPRPNIALRIEDVSRRMVANVPDLLTDLVEIATYVFCADQAVSRGGDVMKAMGTAWRRQFRLVIPVREPERWSSPEVSGSLTDALTFLSDDEFRFEFTELSRPRAFQSYLDLECDASAAFRPDEVVLFSGGLNSLGGAIDELAGHGRDVALVSHQSSPKMSKRQRQLAAELTNRFPGRVLHVPVRVTRQGLVALETTQRTRTFLFASLAIVVARMLGRNRILFFENGVVSFNLPIASQVVGTRATRTTHPRVLHELGRFLTALLTIEVKVDNPFIWMTKAEVAKVIAAHGHADLIRHSVSCSRVHAMTKLHTHCGTCSQCLDRRFATLSAGLDEEDPTEMYFVDLLTGARDEGAGRTMAEAFVRRALEFRRMTRNRLPGEIRG